MTSRSATAHHHPHVAGQAVGTTSNLNEMLIKPHEPRWLLYGVSRLALGHVTVTAIGHVTVTVMHTAQRIPEGWEFRRAQGLKNQGQ